MRLVQAGDPMSMHSLPIHLYSVESEGGLAALKAAGLSPSLGRTAAVSYFPLLRLSQTLSMSLTPGDGTTLQSSLKDKGRRTLLLQQGVPVWKTERGPWPDKTLGIMEDLDPSLCAGGPLLHPVFLSIL